jgi:hypothetical protein
MWFGFGKSILQPQSMRIRTHHPQPRVFNFENKKNFGTHWETENFRNSQNFSSNLNWIQFFKKTLTWFHWRSRLQQPFSTAWSDAAACRASTWRSVVGGQGCSRAGAWGQSLRRLKNPGIKCVFGWKFRVYKPYLYSGLTWSRIWAFWRDFERAGWIPMKKFRWSTRFVSVVTEKPEISEKSETFGRN